MTILEDEPKLASIDSMQDDDHFVCCKVEKGFSGVTTGFCGAPVLLDSTDPEWVEEVACKKCTEISVTDVWYCPLGHNCREHDDGED